jgi:molecular chaperone GrpE (heat shock protein)
MSCYFRHLKEILDQAGIEVTGENKKDIDRAIHKVMDTEYKLPRYLEESKRNY